MPPPVFESRQSWKSPQPLGRRRVPSPVFESRQSGSDYQLRLFVTHDQEEALELVDQVVVMRNARSEQVGAPQAIYDHPRSPFVYEFLGNVNKLTDPAGGDPTYVRPHELSSCPDPPASGCLLSWPNGSALATN